MICGFKNYVWQELRPSVSRVGHRPLNHEPSQLHCTNQSEFGGRETIPGPECAQWAGFLGAKQCLPKCSPKHCKIPAETEAWLLTMPTPSPCSKVSLVPHEHDPKQLLRGSVLS